jgi:transcription elongation factor Elf1
MTDGKETPKKTAKKPRNRNRKYKVTPLWEQKRQIVHELLRVRDGRIYYEQWVFRPEEFSCGYCNDSTNVVFSRQSPVNNVIKSCKHCGVTEKVEEVDESNVAQAVLVYGPSPISDADVKAFVERNRIRKEFLHPVVMRVYTSKPKKAVDVEGLELEE